MVVYGRTVHTNRCSIFEILWPDGTILPPSRRYLLRDFDTANPEEQDLDYSLNRCTSGTDPHMPEAFQTDIISPGIKNPCKGKAFFIEDYVTELAALIPPIPTGEIPSEGCEPDQINAPPEMYSDMDQDRFFDIREKELSQQKRMCVKDLGAETEYSKVELTTDKTDKKLKHWVIHRKVYLTA